MKKNPVRGGAAAPIFIMTSSWFSSWMMTGLSLPGALLNRDHDPIIGLNTRDLLPRSSKKINEYLPHI